jgi:hypothetical protein
MPAQFCTLVLDSSVYPDGFPHQTRALHRPEPREAVSEARGIQHLRALKEHLGLDVLISLPKPPPR